MSASGIVSSAWATHVLDWLDVGSVVGPGSVDVCYADPPFNTGQTQRTPAAAGRAGRSVLASYHDAWPTPREYAAWLRARLEVTIPLLRPSGSILLHLDQRMSHHARVLLDELLGPDRFVNHIIWHYGLGGSSPRAFARKHDDILFYCVDPTRYFFEPPMVPATSRRMAGRLKKATDVLDIPSLNNMASERTGYPTQKPTALLDLLIRACCPAGGLVLDPCCGSGTTVVAAITADRRAVGCDVSPGAIELTRTRLAGCVGV